MVRAPSLIRSAVVAFIVHLSAPMSATAQDVPDIRAGIGGSWVRVFDGVGYAVVLDVRWAVPLDLWNADHTVGLQAWYGSSDIATNSGVGERRTLAGVGANWRTSFRLVSGLVRPYVSVPVQYVRSSIPDPVIPLPQIPLHLLPPGRTPSQDRPGTASGLAVGWGGGCEFWPGQALGIGAGFTLLYQHLYEDAGTPFLFLSLGLLYSTQGLIDASG